MALPAAVRSLARNLPYIHAGETPALPVPRSLTKDLSYTPGRSPETDHPALWHNGRMAKVVFPDHLLASTGGVRELEVVCENFRDLTRRLEAKWPGIEEALSKTSVAIDGQIYQDAWLEPIGPTSEVFFMQRIEGG